MLVQHTATVRAEERREELRTDKMKYYVAVLIHVWQLFPTTEHWFITFLKVIISSLPYRL